MEGRCLQNVLLPGHEISATSERALFYIRMIAVVLGPLSCTVAGSNRPHISSRSSFHVLFYS